MANNSFFDPLKDTFGGLGKQLKNLGSDLFTDIGSMFKGVGTPDKPPQLTPVSANIQPYYQVSADDLDLSSVALKNNIPLQQLVEFNGGAQSLPPAGSYLALQNEQATGFASQNPNPSPTLVTYQPTTIQGRGNPAGQMLVDNREKVNNAFTQFNEAYRLTGQVDTNMLPGDITVSTVKSLEQKGFFANAVDANGVPLSPAQALQQYGYTFKDGKFIKTGSPGAGNNQQGPQAGQVMDNKFVAVFNHNKGQIVWRRIGGKGDQKKKAPPPPGANAAATPQTTLDLNLGSG